MQDLPIPIVRAKLYPPPMPPDLTDGDIAGGEMDVATAQIAWWATRNMLVSLNYRRTWTDRFGIDGEMDAMGMRVALFLQ